MTVGRSALVVLIVRRLPLASLAKLLCIDESGIRSVLVGQQFIACAALENTAVVDNEHVISTPDSGQTVSDSDDSCTLWRQVSVSFIKGTAPR